jgi:MFS family permease
MSAGAARLLRRYYVYSGLYTLAASIIWGVNTLFLLDAGLTVGQVFLANSAFSIGMLVFELPTGVTADTLGRRASFLLSVAVLASTTLGYVGLAAAGGGVVSFAAMSVLMGFGFTFYSGAMEAWLVDGLSHHGFDGGLDAVFGRGQVISGAAMIAGTVGGGALGQVDLSIPFLTRTGLLAALFVLAFRGMRDYGFEPRRVRVADLPREALETGKAGIGFTLAHRPLRLLMIATAVQSGFFAWAWYAWQPYFLELLERDAVWVAGLVAALLALAMMLGNGLVATITSWCGRRTTVFLWGTAVFSLAMAGVGFAKDFAPALALLLVAALASGVQTPVRQAFVHQVVPREQRATIVSVDSMVTAAAGSVAQPALGALSDQRGFSAGYIVGGLATLIAFPVFALVRKARDPADRFVGPEADQSCPTPAIPPISLVDGELELSGV